MKWYTSSRIPLLFCVGLLIVTGVSCHKKDKQMRVDYRMWYNHRFFKHDTAFVLEDSPEEDIQRKVLVEEMTGVYCYTCPLAHDTVAALIEDYPGRIVAINIHSHAYGIYDNPKVLGNKYDFRTEDGDHIVEYLGGIISVPSAAIDRVVLPPDTGIISFKRALWRDYVGRRLELPSPLEIKLQHLNTDVITPGERAINVKIRITKNIHGRIAYGLALVENNIIDKQFRDTMVIDDYHHQHILRRLLTDVKGDFLMENPAPGQVFVRYHKLKIPPEFKPQDVQIITYVTLMDTKEVLQSEWLKF